MTGQPTTIAPDSPPLPAHDAGTGDAAELVLEDRFSIVPEWVLDADIGDCALRLYAVLLRYGNTTGARMPARSTLAARLHKKSTDTVDRALAELVALGAVQIEPRWAGRQRLTNRYRIRTSRPSSSGPTSPAASGSSPGGGRTNAATPVAAGSGVAAPIGAGWPHESGRTESVLPRHHHPLLPRKTLPRRTRPPGEVVVDLRIVKGLGARAALAPAPSRSSTGSVGTHACLPTAASMTGVAGASTSPGSTKPEETPGSH